MKIIDFLVYHLRYWFNLPKNKNKLVWSTPLQRAIYGIMLSSAGLFVFIEILLENTIWKQSGFRISKFIYVILAIGLNYLLEYIYIKRDRYEKIAAKGFKIKINIGVIISIVVVFLCIIGWFIYMIIFIPSGKGDF